MEKNMKRVVALILLTLLFLSCTAHTIMEPSPPSDREPWKGGEVEANHKGV